MHMNAQEKQFLRVTCQRFSDNLDFLKPITETYLTKHPQTARIIKSLYESEVEEGNRYPATWFLHQAEAFLFASTFGSRRSITAIRDNDDYDIDRGDREILETWYEQPMRWGVFQIEEFLDDDFFSIYEDGLEDIITLYSPALETLQKSSASRDATYVALLFFNGRCWQTHGPLHYYASLDLEDIWTYCRLLDADAYTKRGINGTIQKHFIRFFQIDEISNLKNIAHRGEILQQLWSQMVFPGFDSSRLLGKWKTKRSGNRYLELSYDGISEKDIETVNLDEIHYPLYLKDKKSYWEADSSRFPTFYFDDETQILGLSALTYSGYDLLFQILRASFGSVDELLRHPHWVMDITLASVIQKSEDMNAPWIEMQSHFTHTQKAISPSPEGGGTMPDMDTLNKLFGELMEAHNEGKTFNRKRASKTYGMSEQAIESLEQQLKQMFAKYDKGFAVPTEEQRWSIDYPVPPPAKRRYFVEELDTDNSPFSVVEDAQSEQTFNALTGNSLTRELEREGISGHISSLFEEAFGWDAGMTIMNSFFMILVHTGNDLIPVRSFAWEILKLFGHILLEQLDVTDQEFITRFSRFVLKKMCTNAICEITERPSTEDLLRGTYLIRSTVFFREFLFLNP